jgi:radical SAM superfamily enzyme YgiQ (UPF0313 family)
VSRSGVLLLSCYELGRQPSGLSWPLAFLERAGIPARAVDLAIDPLPEDTVRAAGLVVVSVPMHTALRLGILAGRRVRDLNPGVHICYFGAYAWLNAELLLREAADSVIAGEGEETLARLAAALARGVNPESVPGVFTPGRPAAPVMERLAFPTPSRSGLPRLDRYAQLVRGDHRVPVAFAESSRGCRHTCRHCPVVPVYGGRFFAVPVETVVEDVRRQVAAGARHVSFGDPDFLNGPTHALRVARTLHAEHPDLTFDFTAKVEHLLRHAELLPELRALGCLFVVSALESLSDRVLAELHKGHTGADADHLVDVLDAAGIDLQPTFVPFTPWSSLEDYAALLDWIAARGLVRHVPAVQLAVRLLIPPGSALLGENGQPTWLGPRDDEALGYGWRHGDERMDALHAEVSAVAERAEAAGQDELATFGAIRRSVSRLRGAEPPLPIPAQRPTPPRLSEAWFCCSEPTGGQLGLVAGDAALPASGPAGSMRSLE